MSNKTEIKNPVLDSIIHDYKMLMPMRALTAKYGITEGYLRVLMNVNNITRHNVTRIKRRVWKKEDTDYLRNNYGKIGMNLIIEHLDRPEISIRVKANMLNLYCDGKRMECNISVIRENYRNNIIDIYNKISFDCKTLVEAASKISETIKISPEILGNILKRSNIARPSRGNSNYNKTWTYYEVKRLNELYKINSAKTCAKLMNRTFYAVKSKIKEKKITK